MFMKLGKLTAALALALLGLASTAGLTVPTSAEAATCTHGATRWWYEGCCGTTYNPGTKYRLQWCNRGTWTNTTTTDCRLGGCLH